MNTEGTHPNAPELLAPARVAEAINNRPAPCVVTVAANSLKLFLNAADYPSDRGVQQRYLWIDPPWRWTHHGAFVLGSSDVPHPDDFQDKAAYEDAFREWVASFQPFRDSVRSGVAIRIADGVPDLVVEAADGHRIDAFVDATEWSCWHYEDMANGMSIDALPSGLWQQRRDGE